MNHYKKNFAYVVLVVYNKLHMNFKLSLYVVSCFVSADNTPLHRQSFSYRDSSIPTSLVYFVCFVSKILVCNNLKNIAYRNKKLKQE